MPNVTEMRYRWEDTELQADLTMGNLASALTLQSEEAALIAELRAGSEEAFAWLITRFHQPIYSLLARMVYDRDDAADLTQEVFVKVFRGVHSFQIGRSVCGADHTLSSTHLLAAGAHGVRP